MKVKYKILDRKKCYLTSRLARPCPTHSACNLLHTDTFAERLFEGCVTTQAIFYFFLHFFDYKKPSKEDSQNMLLKIRKRPNKSIYDIDLSRTNLKVVHFKSRGHGRFDIGHVLFKNVFIQNSQNCFLLVSIYKKYKSYFPCPPQLFLTNLQHTYRKGICHK